MRATPLANGEAPGEAGGEGTNTGTVTEKGGVAS
jgi:hypothetical protein